MMLFVEDGKEFGISRLGFGRPKKEEAAGLDGIVEVTNQLILRRSVQVN
jgi:hypothetical protein